MKLKKFHMKKVTLTDIDGELFVGTVYFCDKKDYDADEDGVEMLVDSDIVIFYESDIKSIEVM